MIRMLKHILVLAVIFTLPTAVFAKTDAQECETRLAAHSEFVSEALAAIGHYPQMEAGVRAKVLGYLLQHVSIPVELTLQAVDDADINSAAITMDRIHMAMGFSALSFRKIDQPILESDLSTMAGQIRGVDHAQAEKYLQTVMGRGRVRTDGIVVTRVDE